MKRIIYTWFAAVILAAIFIPLANAQSGSLGDYARAIRKDKNVTERVRNEHVGYRIFLFRLHADSAFAAGRGFPS